MMNCVHHYGRRYSQTLYRRIYSSAVRHSLHSNPIHSVATSNTPLSPSVSKRMISFLISSEYPARPLADLPFSILMRSYLISILSSSPSLLTPTLRLLSKLANSRSPLLNPDRNILLWYLLKKTFYVHFCAGETAKEVRNTTEGLKRMGYQGVILGYGKEIVANNKASAIKEDEMNDIDDQAAMKAWKQGNLETVRLAEKGDFVAIKFTGAGPYVVRLLRDGVPPCKRVEGVLTEICEFAKTRGVSLLIDAEQNFLQDGIFRWTLQYQKRFNSVARCKSTVYGTYQAYLRSTPSILAQHLAFAQEEGIMLGIKLVRGAYMGSDPRPLFWDTKRETDEVYDGIARALIQRQYNDMLKPINTCVSNQLPKVNMLLATHNHTSVQEAMKLRKEQTDQRDQQTEFGYGQLMGMADEISGELIQARKLEKGSDTPVTKAYKYVPWGTVSECIQYCVRRAEENRDAAERAKEGRTALKEELIRRILRRT